MANHCTDSTIQLGIQVEMEKACNKTYMHSYDNKMFPVNFPCVE